VNWYEASAYCGFAGGRLATEAEWEYAASSGGKTREYPWGNDKPDEFKANFYGGPGHPTPVGLYPEGATRSGIEHMAGNVLEWVEDEWAGSRVLRGGSYNFFARGLRVSGRSRVGAGGRVGNIGFRCVRELLSL
jgi:formylglycine-generating enzyme required for sulfatase activity